MKLEAHLRVKIPQKIKEFLQTKIKKVNFWRALVLFIGPLIPSFGLLMMSDEP